jgi:hypothetical protein
VLHLSDKGNSEIFLISSMSLVEVGQNYGKNKSSIHNIVLHCIHSEASRFCSSIVDSLEPYTCRHPRVYCILSAHDTEWAL